MHRLRLPLGLLAVISLGTAPAFAQGTAFSYQGRLSAAGAPATGPYEMRFTLHDAPAGGTAPGTPVVLTVFVTEGLFSVDQLDFGPCPTCFDGSPRFLEVGVRPSGSPAAFTVLSPRQVITAAPYAIRSTTAANATHLEGFDAGDFIQNGTTPQAGAFNVTGNGTIGGSLFVGGSFSLAIVNAQTQYNLGGQRVLAVGGVANANLVLGLGGGNPTGGDANTFLGSSAGSLNAAGEFDTLVGASAGLKNTTGSHNTLVGAFAGWNNTSGAFNSFFGRGAGGANTTGSFNALFGAGAGDHITTGSDNAIFGTSAGNFNVSGNDNAFFGREAGLNNQASGNAFFGRSAGRANVNGTLNAFFGSGAGQATTECCNAFFGAFAGVRNTTGSLNAFFGENAGSLNTAGFGNVFLGEEAGFDVVANSGNTGGSSNTFVGLQSGKGNITGSSNTTVGARTNVGAAGLTFATALGADAVVSASNTVVLGRSADTVRIPGNLVVAGSVSGGNSYIQNGTALQPSSSFNISDGGSANILDARGEYRLQGLRFVSTSMEASNTFVGSQAGNLTSSGSFNSLLGTFAGDRLTDGASNAFLGAFAGEHTSSGSGNVFVGMVAGQANTSGSNNTFVGSGAGVTNATGNGNTLVGFQAAGGTATANASAIGSRAMVTRDDAIVLGAIAGLNGATADTNVGIGTTAPRAKLEVAGGDVYLSSAVNGVVLKAPNGSCWRLTVANGGALGTAVIACP